MRIVFCFSAEHSGEVKGKVSLLLPGGNIQLFLKNSPIVPHKHEQVKPLFSKGGTFAILPKQ